MGWMCCRLLSRRRWLHPFFFYPTAQHRRAVVHLNNYGAVNYTRKKSKSETLRLAYPIKCQTGTPRRWRTNASLSHHHSSFLYLAVTSVLTTLESLWKLKSSYFVGRRTLLFRVLLFFILRCISPQPKELRGMCTRAHYLQPCGELVPQLALSKRIMFFQTRRRAHAQWCQGDAK